MARYTEKDRENAIAKLITSINPKTKQPNYSKVSKETGISRNALRQWYKEEDTDKIEQLRTLKKAEFINNAWEVINEAFPVLKKKVGFASAGQISTIIATMYDKQALASGDPTERTDEKVNIIFKDE
ncbi:MAG: hypothetical protein WC877_07445 [Dehalococcoidales bacterium]|jgi:methylphosphotriester-DNA--protein-cysteine methyltransferase